MQDYRRFIQSGMNSDDAIENIGPNDTISSYNFRVTGNIEGEAGDGTNIESNEIIAGTRQLGINKAIGVERFENVRKAYAFVYNSQGFHLILEFDYDTETESILFTNKTDSGGIDIMPLNPQYYVNDIKLINDKYLAFTDNNMQPGYINLERLKSGGYGVLTEDDVRLIKAQPIIQPKAIYNNDSGRSVNLLRGRLFQFREQYVGLDDEYTAWGMMSKRIVPEQESTPTLGTDVTKSNNIIVTVPIGTNRVKTINISARYDMLDWFTIKTINRSEVLSLQATEVDVFQEIYESYDPATGLYSFAFYNDGLYPNVAVLETDLPYDYVPLKAGALEVINGNILAMGDIKEGYPRPTTSVSLSSSSYNPNLIVPSENQTDALRVVYTKNERIDFSHKRQVYIDFMGLPKTGDVVTIQTRNIGDYIDTRTYSSAVSITEEDQLLAFVIKLSKQVPDYAIQTITPGQRYRLIFATESYQEFSKVDIDLFNAGGGVTKSIHALKGNSSYQAALRYRDKYGRYFPLVTNNKDFVFKTLSYAQSNGLTPLMSWTINDLIAPEGAVDYQWMLSENNTHDTTLFINASLNVSLSSADYLVFNITPLLDFNKKNSSSVLSYDYSPEDRCTFLYTFAGDNTPIKWFNNPAIDVEVVEFKIEVVGSTTNYLLKVRKSSSIIISDYTGSNKQVLLEIYTPKKRTTTTNSITSYNSTLFYEIGERFDIINGQHSVLSGNITDGDVYFKTRELDGAPNPNTLYTLIVEDFNFSDFYKSDYTSYGRPGAYFDTPEGITKKASIRYSDVFIAGSKTNGITRFYGERIYGDSDGEASSNYGHIRKLRQRDNYVVCIQELKLGHIPVFTSILENQSEQLNVAISDKILNNIRYSQSGSYGMGNAKESYAESKNGTIYFIDPNNSVPMRDGYDGLSPISVKMSKFFKKTLQKAYKEGKKIIGYWDEYNKEYVLSIETEGDIVTSFSFINSNWETENDYVINPLLLSILTPPTKGIVSINSMGIATYTPNNGETGLDSFMFRFPNGSDTILKRTCITITPGTTTINPFYFIDLLGQQVNTLLNSNSVLIIGNNIAVPISVTNGEYSINNGIFSSSPGMINSGDTVIVRQTSSVLYDTTTTTTLTVSGYSNGFDVTTRSEFETYKTFLLSQVNRKIKIDALDGSIICTITCNITYTVDIYDTDGNYEYTTDQNTVVLILPSGDEEAFTDNLIPASLYDIINIVFITYSPSTCDGASIYINY